MLNSFSWVHWSKHSHATANFPLSCDQCIIKWIICVLKESMRWLSVDQYSWPVPRIVISINTRLKSWLILGPHSIDTWKTVSWWWVGCQPTCINGLKISCLSTDCRPWSWQCQSSVYWGVNWVLIESRSRISIEDIDQHSSMDATWLN